MFDQSQHSDHGSQSVIIQHTSQHINSLELSPGTSLDHPMFRVAGVTNGELHRNHAPLVPPSSIHQLRRKSDSDIQPPSGVPTSTEVIHPHSQPISPTSHSIITRVSEVDIHDSGSSSQNIHHFEMPPHRNQGIHQAGALLDGPPSLGGLSVIGESPRRSITKEPGPNKVGRPSSSSHPLTYPCQICNDRSTGKHYGAYSCDGCKGFFRRSIRKKNTYSCRFSRKCNITKDQRNQCRYCRLQKCVNSGMKKEAVQNERDRITQRKHTPEGALSLAILINAENQCKQPGEQFTNSDPPCLIATVSDVAQSVKQQLLVLVEWAKAIPCFTELNLEDRIKLLKAHSGEHLLMGIAWRSLATDGYLLLGNDMLIPRLEPGEVMNRHGRFQSGTTTSGTDINWIASRILDDVVHPLRTNHVDEKEFMCLRTMIFFDPMLHGLENKEAISTIRLQAQLLLEDYISDRQDFEPRGRFGQMMFMLPYLQSIATAMIQQIQYAKLEGLPEIEPLIQEMLLGSLAEVDKDRYAFPPPVVTPAMYNKAASRHMYCCNNCDETSRTENNSEEQIMPIHDHITSAIHGQSPSRVNDSSSGRPNSEMNIHHGPSSLSTYADSVGTIYREPGNPHQSPIHSNQISEIGCQGLDLSCSNTNQRQNSYYSSSCNREDPQERSSDIFNEFNEGANVSEIRKSTISPLHQDSSKTNISLDQKTMRKYYNYRYEKYPNKVAKMSAMSEPFDLSPYASSNYSTSSEAASPDVMN